MSTPHGEIVVLSCYSPAWAIATPTPAPSNAEQASVKLKAAKKSQVWVCDLVWACIEDLRQQGREVIAAGDFNLSVAFDDTFGSGNREFVERMAASELTEVVRHFHPDERSTPTFRNARSKRIEHQLDYVWVTPGLRHRLKTCSIGDEQLLLDRVSDHLPVTFEIDL